MYVPLHYAVQQTENTIGQNKSNEKPTKHQVRTNSYCTKSLETTLTPRNFVEDVQFLMADAGDLAQKDSKSIDHPLN